MKHFDTLKDIVDYVEELKVVAKERKANLIIIDDENQPYFFDFLLYETPDNENESRERLSQFEQLYDCEYYPRHYTVSLETKAQTVYPGEIWIKV